MPRVQVPVTSVTPPKAALTTAMSGTHNDLTLTAREGGPGGNSIRFEINVAGNNTPLTVAVAGYDIVVQSATSGAGAATSTASQVLTALAANADAMRLVTVALAASNDGTGIVADMALTALTGGSLATTPPSQVDGDATNGHYFTGNDGQIELEVVSSDGSSRTVSVDYSPHAVPVTDVAAEVVTIPAGATRKLGPFSVGAFDQNAAGEVYFTPSVATTLKFRAYKTIRASSAPVR